MPGRDTNTIGRWTAAAAFLLALSLLAAPGAADHAPSNDLAPATDARFVRVSENSSEVLWPYTSRRPAHDAATLPINVVVANDPAFVRFLLSRTTASEWNVTEYQVDVAAPDATEGNASSVVESGVVLNGTRLEWTGARGSNRYTYVHDTASGEGRWVGETYQLHHGTYFGSRYHVRMYEGGSGRNTWTAIQVHREHWDWFRLRHSVDSVDRAQDHLESEFRSSARGHHLRRTFYDNGGALDADGWVTWIELGFGGLGPALLWGVALLSGHLAAVPIDVDLGRIRSAPRDRRGRRPADLRYLALASSLSVVVPGVRIAAIAVETTFPALSPKLIAGVFYPLLVLASPAAAVGLARGLDPGRSALAASAGFGAGILADYLYIGVGVVPVGVLLHRSALLAAVAVLAAGGAGRGTSPAGAVGAPANRLVALGAAGWVAALVIPLSDLL